MEKENLPARATETGTYAMTKLRGEVRGVGLMIGVELVKAEKLTPATTEAEAIRDALLRNSVLVGAVLRSVRCRVEQPNFAVQ